jgi:dipeptidyl aminopeptidase/acylaminoacyl peptidase
MNAIGAENFSLAVASKEGERWVSQPIPGYGIRAVPYLSFLFPFSLSPAGDKLIMVTPVSAIATEWKRYQPADSFERLRFNSADVGRTDPGNLMRPQEYSLVDLKSGRVTPLLGAPNARALAYLGTNQAVWAPDGRRVLVTNTFLPLKGKNGEEDLRRLPCAVASIDLPRLETHCLRFEEADETLALQELAFGRTRNQVLLTTGTSHHLHTTTFQLQQGSWRPDWSQEVGEDLATSGRRRPSTTPGSPDLKLFIQQDLNVPPALWVTDTSRAESYQIWDPNPQFAHIRFGKASAFQWHDRNGLAWKGALVKPVGYVPGKRYPLILQMYSFVAGQFLTDGTDPTAFAARELASVGFMVLQIQKKPDTMTEADPEQGLIGYQSAIDTLSEAGLIDRTKVGVTGFSWTCWYVANALIKDPTLFAAATIADGLDNGYMQYLLFAEGSTPIRRQMESIREGPPFGNGLQHWIDTAPGFHFDQVQAPLRIEAINPWSLLGEWACYASLRMQEKPVDLIYFPHGTHIHQKPLERLESQQGTIDWLLFWLQGYRDPSPTKDAQYQRWDKLRTLWEKSQERGDTPSAPARH